MPLDLNLIRHAMLQNKTAIDFCNLSMVTVARTLGVCVVRSFPVGTSEGLRRVKQTTEDE